MPLQNTRPCPCLLAASLHTGSFLPGHGSRGAGVSVCAFVCVYWGIQCIEWVGKPAYICACVRPRIKGYSCVCVMFFGVIMLLMSMQKAQTADGFSACGRLMWAWVFACDSKREGDRRIQHVRMCAGVFRQMTPYTPPPPQPTIPSPCTPPPRKAIHPTHISTPPCSGLYTMFSPRLACHFLAQDFRMDVIGQGQSQIMFSLMTEWQQNNIKQLYWSPREELV